MKNRIATFISTFLIFSILSPTASIAIDATTSGRILDNFKNQQEDILFESSPIEVVDSNRILEQEYAMNGLDSLKSRLQSMQSIYTIKKDTVTETRVTLEKALSVLLDSIQSTEKSIENANIAILQKQTKIQNLRSDWLALKSRIRDHRKVILSYVTNIYSEWNSVLDDAGNIDIIKGMILTTEDTDYSLSDITYKTLVTQMWQKFVNEYRDLVRDYYLAQIQTKDEEVQLVSLKLDLENLIKKNRKRKAHRDYKRGRSSLCKIYRITTTGTISTRNFMEGSKW